MPPCAARRSPNFLPLKHAIDLARPLLMGAVPERHRAARRGAARLRRRVALLRRAGADAPAAAASDRLKTESFFAPCPRGLEAPLAAELHGARRHVRHADRRRRRRSRDRSSSPTTRTSNRGSRAASCGASRTAAIATRTSSTRSRDGIDWRAALQGRAHAARRRRGDALAARRASSSRRSRSRTRSATAFATTAGKRPSVDKQRPDVRVHAFLTEREATLYLDTSGEALFKRG